MKTVFDTSGTPTETNGGKIVRTPTQPPAPPSAAAMVSALAPPQVIETSVIAQQDSRYIDLSTQLPSGMGFYGFNTLAARPFGAQEVQKMHRAIVESSVKHQIDAISACLDHSAYDLTLGDFQYLMYWERVNSYKRHPVTVNWTCRNPEHVMKVGRGELPPDSVQQQHIVHKEHLVERVLDFEKCDKYMREFFDKYGLYLWTPMVRDLVEGIHAELDADTDWWNKYAGMLNPMHHGQTLAERRTFLQNHEITGDADIMFDLEHWGDLCDHGVVEEVEAVCSHCGDQSKQVFRIDPLSFLPSGK